MAACSSVCSALSHAFAHLPRGQDANHGSAHEDETRWPLSAQDANNASNKGDEGERKRSPCHPQRLPVFWIKECHKGKAA